MPDGRCPGEIPGSYRGRAGTPGDEALVRRSSGNLGIKNLRKKSNTLCALLDLCKGWISLNLIIYFFHSFWLKLPFAE